MSQNKQSLRVVARDSGFEEYIIRPLSAKLLPVTRPEQEGKVDRERLLDIQGRSRKRQMELAKKYDITEFPEPAGGCRLTEPNFSKRLKDLMTHNINFSINDIELLKVGRHLRLDDQVKCIVGRNEQDNNRIEELRHRGVILLKTEEVAGPVVLITCSSEDVPSKELLLRAASICVRYSDAPDGAMVDVSVYQNSESTKITTAGCSEDETARIII
jgi:hypothetical protein